MKRGIFPAKSMLYCIGNGRTPTVSTGLTENSVKNRPSGPVFSAIRQNIDIKQQSDESSQRAMEATSTGRVGV
jgi:hypothetical protein